LSAKQKKRILFIADHASNYIPSSLKDLGLKKNLLNSHIAYDLGVKELCINLANILKSKYIIGEYSRLIIDLNRDKSDPTLIPEIVDRTVIKKNIILNENDKKKRISNIYNRYHQKIKTTIKHDNITILISLHSFNPIFKNKKRNIHFGILSNQDRRLSDYIITEMKQRKLKIGDNEPYKGNLIGDTMHKHGLKNNLHHTLIEIRNDLLSSPTKIQKVSKLLKEVISNSIYRI
jgi:predicted N-formylglutamate amidohydrolase|tara:strand:+ start:366 stop:1064 length:699 start_codon:yes stop_codon:yes gene_type:complete